MGAELFYVSMTRTDANNENDLWSDFGELGYWVRLRLRVDTTAEPETLRAIQYRQAGEKDLLQAINEALAAENFPPIAPEGTYRAGAFTLPATLEHETDVRLLHLRLPSERTNMATTGVGTTGRFR